ncbi:MAG: hypothetical protein IPH53_03035 [Flavobacteriales bacterium]|nr:hypothetical protein [Flavobacteriales bacterium]MBK7083679.1 hypothetical protein [Flavobacteriales bacterium]MBK7753510.1 hypothetical protein [Flavobacteriales bacterium]MBK9077050.1 hypothetical protein [Flavobacteriales bacterium]MBK9538470.1 hypothetical protein [Flavobacteriales bacterium]
MATALALSATLLSGSLFAQAVDSAEPAPMALDTAVIQTVLDALDQMVLCTPERADPWAASPAYGIWARGGESTCTCACPMHGWRDYIDGPDAILPLVRFMSPAQPPTPTTKP